jgi:copper(I)-binding protein
MTKISKFNPIFLTIIVGIVIGLPTHAHHADTDIRIENAYVPQLPPTTMSRAAYLTIINDSGKKRTITNIHAVGFQMAHFHQTVMKDGVMSMNSIPSLEIKPGETLNLKPGGLHIMLMNPDKSLANNDEVLISLSFANGDSVNFVALVQAAN